jgi:hypothetical protein
MEIEKLHLKQIAKMAKKFADIPEGNGTMLDNTMIVYMSCSSGDHHCAGHDWPVVLLGGMGKKLKAGRYLEYPKVRQQRPPNCRELLPFLDARPRECKLPIPLASWIPTSRISTSMAPSES